jgi:hypothetical protein
MPEDRQGYLHTDGELEAYAMPRRGLVVSVCLLRCRGLAMV